ncbi:hypothetical protein KIPB_001083 [Kipferlia bialata]|uniref:Uncharacterized protein n=1 Tax=Kipferlia bialata TaxID=797122 RepID=A0A9K3GFI2_9EUKA|nr:hypothetical protein KIPB_001083 [Kipferlia bialata]|eukprot:g1083.t1
MGVAEKKMAKLLRTAARLQKLVDGFAGLDKVEDEDALRRYFESKVVLARVEEFFRTIGCVWQFGSKDGTQGFDIMQLQRNVTHQCSAFKDWTERFLTGQSAGAEAQGLLNMINSLETDSRKAEREIFSRIAADQAPVPTAAPKGEKVKQVKQVKRGKGGKKKREKERQGLPEEPVRPQSNSCWSGLCWVISGVATGAALAAAFAAVTLTAPVIGCAAAVSAGVAVCAVKQAQRIAAFDAKEMEEYQARLAEYIRAVATEQAAIQVAKNATAKRVAMEKHWREGRERGGEEVIYVTLT